MPVRGIGTDVVALGRVDAVLTEHGERFLQRVLTPVEMAQKDWDGAKLARRWAIKEAVAKAVGSGISGVVGFQDIEVSYTGAGQPQVAVRGFDDADFWVSVSDDCAAGVAVAFCVMESAR